MKKTIIFNGSKRDIPCLLNGMILEDYKSSLRNKDEYECVYRTKEAHELREAIAQRNNAKALEEIKPLTTGYTGAGFVLLNWGGEKAEQIFIDEWKKETNKKEKAPIELINAVRESKEQEEINQLALWYGLIKKLAPNEKRSINELLSSYREVVPAPRLVSCGRPSRAKKFKARGDKYLREDGSPKYVIHTSPNTWRVMASCKGVSIRKGTFHNYDEACAAARSLADEIQTL